MKNHQRRIELGIVAAVCLVVSPQISIAASDFAEKISHVSPDGEFALLVSYDEELNNESNATGTAKSKQIDPATIKRLDLVAMPSKKIVVNLLAEDVLGGYTGPTMIWSADSKWFAIYSGYSRTGDTQVYRRNGNEFILALQTDDAQVHSEKGLADAEVRNEYVRPVRWTKSGRLLL